jgi:DNA-binding NarL/FixJ family response regulator
MVPLIQRIDRQLAALPSAGTALAEANPDGLTPREVEVLRLVARGYTNKEIGERLYISRHTAATHVQHILDKTGMSNRAEVTAYAANKDLL